MFMDVRMCDALYSMYERKANKVKKSGIRPPNPLYKKVLESDVQ
jgi:hypothetical protein